MDILLTVHALATMAMTGVIWFVQIVHYPLMDGVGRDRFSAYEARHSLRTTWVVAPLMIVEAVTAAMLLVRRPAEIPAPAAWLGFGLVALIWISTAAVQVPCHRALGRGFDAAVHRRLVATNWIRTAAWTARGALVAWWLT